MHAFSHASIFYTYFTIMIQMDKFKKAGIIFATTSIINTALAFAGSLLVGPNIIIFFGPIIDFTSNFGVYSFSDNVGLILSALSISLIGLILSYFIYRGHKTATNLTLFVILSYIFMAFFMTLNQSQGIRYNLRGYFFIFQAILIKVVQSYFLIGASKEASD